MTDQEAYDLIFDWLARPGATKCMEGETNDCVYDNGEGNHCAIGGPMKDILDFKVTYSEESYRNINPAYKRRTVRIGDYIGGIDDLMGDSEKVRDFWGEAAESGFLGDAQYAHDGASFENFQRDALERLNRMAENYRINTKPIPVYVTEKEY